MFGLASRASGDGWYWAHTQGVYDVMQALLKEFPGLIIETCAAGGRRFDYGIMRFSRATWASDATQPAHVVRSHVFGASHAYPSQYLTTWYVRSSQDLSSIGVEPAQIDSLFRSRMMGAFGISDVLSKWSPEIERSGRRSITLYKRLRRFLRGQKAWLTPQPTCMRLRWSYPTNGTLCSTGFQRRMSL
jgi:alpha-galactosidase